MYVDVLSLVHGQPHCVLYVLYCIICIKTYYVCIVEPSWGKQLKQECKMAHQKERKKLATGSATG